MLLLFLFFFFRFSIAIGSEAAGHMYAIERVRVPEHSANVMCAPEYECNKRAFWVALR